ncbi:MAG: ABC transporter permease [Candidatus Micrarchaeota archaeon]|nr:ABC transporter permease [Candidatus Micrarchaeota archaeon]
MGLVGDTYTLFLREMLIFKKSLGTNFARALLFPIIFILFLGSAGSSPKNVPISVVNYDNGLSALNFINQIQAGSSLKVTSATTEQQALNLLSKGTVAAVVVIPTGFSSGTANEVYMYLDGSQPQAVSVVTGTINSVASKFQADVVTPNAAEKGSQGVSVISNYAYGAASNYESYVVGGILIMVAAFGSVFGSGFTVLSDRQLGNLKAFLTTPINTSAIFLSKILIGTVQSAFSAYIALGIGLLFGATIAAGALGFLELLWIVFLTGLGFGALSVALASRMKQLQTYALIAQSTTLPLSFLGGAFVPVSLLPATLQATAVVNPVYYAINAVRDIMIKGYLPFNALVINSGALLIFSLVMIAIAAILFKSTSDQI